MSLHTELERFCPHTEAEEIARKELLSLLTTWQENILDRNCPAGHITCSAMVLSPDLQKTLMAYHLIYQSVGWLGGHADGDADLLGVALREVREETSVTQIYPVSRKILSIDILPVHAHEKNGQPVAAHLHYNITYGMIAPEQQPIADKPDENRDVRWLPIEAIETVCTEKHMLPVYQKIIQYIRDIMAEKNACLPEIVQPLSAWYARHKRDLPWRKDADPYHVWVSEIMLQQTRVEAVKAYYLRFLHTLPDIPALAECPEDQLLKLWEGLGYYNRVRNMQNAARSIMQRHHGKFPESYAEIRALSGIGDYTAGAICSICYGMPTPAVDGNVLRVMARLQEDFRNILDAGYKADVTRQLAGIYPLGDCATLTQAFMELGATVCLPNGRPACERCPLKHLCAAYRNCSVAHLPVRIQKQKRHTEQKTVFLLISGDTSSFRIAIRKRSASGLLASLWELPNTEGFLTPEEAIAQCSDWNVRAKEFVKLVRKKHLFTHIIWDMQGVVLQCAEESRENAPFTWVSQAELETVYSLPIAFRMFLKEIKDSIPECRNF